MTNNTILEAAKNWRDLLLGHAKVSHSLELGNSSIIDLASTLDGLLTENARLADESKDYTVDKARLARLEAGAKAQQELSKAKPRPQLIKEADDAVASN